MRTFVRTRSELVAQIVHRTYEGRLRHAAFLGTFRPSVQSLWLPMYRASSLVGAPMPKADRHRN